MLKDLLKDFVFFHGIDEQTLANLTNISVLKKYQKDAIVFYEGEKSPHLHYLAKGSVKIYKNKPNGNEVFIRKFTAPCFIAELANINNIAFPSSASFLTDGIIVKIEYEKFMKLFKNNQKIMDNFIPSLSEKISYLNEFIHNEIVLNSNAKVAKLIVENQEIFQTTKQNQIANELNLAPETFSRILAKFKQDKAIDINGKKVIILNKEYLKGLYL